MQSRAPVAVLLAITMSLTAVAGCLGVEDAGGDASADVVATFYPLSFLASRIGGDNITVATLVGPGIEPHEWEPTTRDVARVASARVYLAQGAGFEPWLDGLVRNLGADAPVVVNTTQGLPLIAGGHDHEHGEEEGEHDAHEEAGHEGEGHEGEESHANESEETAEPAEDADEVDPHTWIDPVLFQRQARAVERALSTAFPEHAAAFEARADALVADLRALDEEYKATLTRCEERVIIVNHNAFTYLAERYEFDVLAISGLEPEAEPDPATVARLVEEAREHNVTIIFFEELVSPQVARTVANEVGAETRLLSPVEGLTGEQRAAGEDYFSLMRENLRNLDDAMRCGQ